MNEPSPAGGAEDTCQQENYYYDSNPFDSAYSQNVSGRLAAVQYMGGHGVSTPSCDTTFTEMYSYGAPGAAVKKKLRVTRTIPIDIPPYSQTKNVDLEATFAYDNEGRMTSEQYPTADVAGPNLGFTYDTMGRLQKLTDLASGGDIINSTVYGPAGELQSMSGAWGTETRGYNSMLQMTAMSSPGVSMQYHFSATQNNGKIDYEIDNLTGEQVNYTYDSLNRLATASTLAGGSPFLNWSDGGAQSHSITVPPSAVTYTANYGTSGQVATPTFSPAGGTYSSSQTVTISTVTSGASIRYTTDGSTPTSTSGILYSSPVTVSASVTLKAIAYKAGMNNSTVNTAAYTIGSGGGGPSWYNASWTYRKPVTIDHTKVSGSSSLADFPVLVSVTDANLKTTGNGGGVGKSDGTDLLFTSSDGVTKLNHELESYVSVRPTPVTRMKRPTGPA